jgi:hypothetical protein
LAESEKFGVTGRLTVKVRLAVWLSAPDVPVMVTVAVPTVAELDAARVSVLVVVADAGLNVAVTPVGSPLAVSDTAPANPFAADMLTVAVPLAPWVTVTAAGETDSEKSGGSDPAMSPTMMPRPFVQK